MPETFFSDTHMHARIYLSIVLQYMVNEVGTLMCIKLDTLIKVRLRLSLFSLFYFLVLGHVSSVVVARSVLWDHLSFYMLWRHLEHGIARSHSFVAVAVAVVVVVGGGDTDCLRHNFMATSTNHACITTASFSPSYFGR